MSFSYTVGGKSRTHTQLGNRGQDQEKEESNRAKNSTLSSTKSTGGSGTARPGGKRNLTGVQPGSNRRVGAKSRPQRAAGTSINKPQQTSTIVTLSDLKKQQSKPQSAVSLIPAKSKSNAAINLPHHSRDSGSGRKLGGHIISDSKLSAARIGVGVRNQPNSPNRPIKSDNSEHLHSRTSASNLKSNHTPAPTAVLQTRGSQARKKTPNVNRTSNKLIDQTLNSNKTSLTSSQRLPGKGRGSRGRGSPRGGMAYNNSRYTSSSLYSANPRPVGQRPPDEEGEDTHQRQGEPGPSQGSPQQPQQQPEGESPGAFRVIQPNASKRQQLLTKSSQEMKALEDYRASKKPTTIRGEARCAGGSKSEEEARQDLEKQHRNKKYEQILKKEQQNREKREREDKEFQEKKAKARQTAEENARRRNAREVNYLRDEHATTNERFLRRFDAERTPPRSETSVSQRSKLQQLREMFPDKKPSKLQKLLEDNNNDVAEVADLLMD